MESEKDFGTCNAANYLGLEKKHGNMRGKPQCINHHTRGNSKRKGTFNPHPGNDMTTKEQNRKKHVSIKGGRADHSNWGKKR